MAAIASFSDLANRLSGGNNGNPEHLSFFKLDRLQNGSAPVASVNGRITSLWGYAGAPGGVDVAVGNSPGAAAVPTQATNGALKQANPGGGRQKWLVGLESVGSAVGSLTLYDRLLHCGSLDGTSTAAQTVGGTLTRYTDGIGNTLFVEIYGALGATATTITASYTNQAGTSGRTTVAVTIGGAGYSEVGRMIALPLQAGDTGVQAVASATLAATTGASGLTTGNGGFGITIAHVFLWNGMAQPGAGFPRDMITGLPQFPEIKTDAALAFAWLAGGTGVPQVFGMLHSVEA